VETLNTVFTLFGTFSSTVKVSLLIGFSILVIGLVFWLRARASRQTSDPLLSDSPLDNRTVKMKLKPIQLLANEAFTEVQVIVYVNGVEFFIPPTQNETWLRIDEEMQEEVIELPKADIYHIRFELHFRTGRKLEGGPVLARGVSTRSTTQKTTGKTPFRLLTLPIKDEYSLYFLDDGSRDMSVKAVIPYEIYAQ
jgi:predicted secreted protein